MTVRRPASTGATQRPGDSRLGERRGQLRRTIVLRLLLAGLLGAGVAVLVSCGSSGTGLIPSANAGPLVADFQAVEQAASKGDGNCAPTKAALSTTEHDFQALPASVNAGLRAKLREGISHLQTLALELCAEPLAQTTTTGESTTTTTTAPPATTTTPPASTNPPTSTSTGTSTAPTGTAPNSGAEGGTSPEVGGSEGEAGEGGAGSGQGGLGSGEASEGANSGGAVGPSGGTGSGQ